MFESVVVEVDDRVACADALVATIAARRRAGAEQLALVAAWADLHCPPPPETLPEPERKRQRVTDTWGGAEGTPQITQAAAVGLGMLLQTTTYAAQRLLRDALELRHRLPNLYAGVMSGRVEDWQAREVARRTHALTLDQARWVDTEVADPVATLPWGRALDVIEAKVIAADPTRHKARLAEEENKRYVATGRRSNTAGLRVLIAQGAAGDIARLEAIIAHLADLLAHAGDPNPLDVRRATALAMLANPAMTCVFLATQHAAADDTADDTGAEAVHDASEAAGTDSATGPTETAVHNKPEEREPVPEPEPEDPSAPSAVELAVAFGRVLKELGTKALDRLRPRSVLYLHCSEEAVRGVAGTQVARVDDPVAGGPIGIDQLRAWLRNHRVTVKPVLDPTGLEPVDEYVIPASTREALRLLVPYESFPWGTLSARQADGDHSKRYVPVDQGGPPGQTGLHNLGPLGRRHHVAKTFDGFTVHQVALGLYYWRTPTGHWYRVDHDGTHPLGRLEEPPIAVTAAQRYDDPTMTPAERHVHELILRKLAA